MYSVNGHTHSIKFPPVHLYFFIRTIVVSIVLKQIVNIMFLKKEKYTIWYCFYLLINYIEHQFKIGKL